MNDLPLWEADTVPIINRERLKRFTTATDALPSWEATTKRIRHPRRDK